MFGHQRRLSTVLEEEPEIEAKRCKLSSNVKEWKIVFELGEEEYRLVRLRAQIALDELLGLVFDYEAGGIYSILADVLFVQCEDEFSVTGIDQETLRKMQKIGKQFNYFGLEALLLKFAALIPDEFAEIMNQLAEAFSSRDCCLPGALRLVLSCLPLAKFKCLAMLTLFLKPFQKQGSIRMTSSCLKLSAQVCSILVNSWELVFLLPTSK